MIINFQPLQLGFSGQFSTGVNTSILIECEQSFRLKMSVFIDFPELVFNIAGIFYLLPAGGSQYR